MKPLALLLVIATILLACNKPKPRHNPISKVQIYTGPCFGDCPVQTVSIDSTLAVNYWGDRNTKYHGFFTATIPQALWDSVNFKLEQIHYKNLKAFYPETYTDGPDYYVLIEHGCVKTYIDASVSGLPDNVYHVFTSILNTYKSVKLTPVKDSIKFDTFKRQRVIDVKSIRFPPKP